MSRGIWLEKHSDYFYLAILVEGYTNGAFSIATTSRCRGELYSFPWIALIYPWFVSYNAEY